MSRRPSGLSEWLTAYCGFYTWRRLAQAKFAFNWSFGKVAGGVVASVLPFGPLVFDAWLGKEAARAPHAEREAASG